MNGKSSLSHFFLSRVPASRVGLFEWGKNESYADSLPIIILDRSWCWLSRLVPSWS